MSAPHTNIEKQEKEHKGPLAGMGMVVVFALLLLFGLTVWLSYDGETPQTPDVRVDGRTGEEVQVEDTPVVDPAAAPSDSAPEQAAPTATE